MRLFPAFFFTDNKHATVFGGGEEARRKVRLLDKTSIKITVIVDDEIESGFAEEFAGRIIIAPRDMAGQALDRSLFAIIACRNDRNTDQSVEWARQFGIPINVVDRPELCDFTVPSIMARGEIVAAIGSGGAAPVLAKRVRTDLEALTPPALGPLSIIARDFRPAVSAALSNGAERRQFWESALHGEAAALALAGKTDEAVVELERLLAEFAACDRRRGRVDLVGAGPGDPELLTLKAFRLIQNADIVFHDRLVSPEILDLIRRDADRVSVGKEKSRHTMPQDDIHRQMIAAAAAGKRVVRLKGGDPFIFGRGGEELQALSAAGIETSVTPGISAALGCAAAAGLPLTHRDHAQSLTFVTGHAKAGGMPEMNWQGLATPHQTVVVFMGVGTADRIASAMIDAGRAADTPVAIIENGTCQNQTKAFGTLATLRETIDHNNITGPALLIIGEVSAIPAAISNQRAMETAP